MAQMKTKEIQELNAYFLPEGFVIDELPNLLADTLKKWKKAFDNDKFSALFHLGFLNKEKWFSPSIEFLHHIAEILIKNLSQQSEIEFYRDKVQVELTDNELYQLKEEIPLSSIMEFKQICNHPDQYLGREEYKAEQSGKVMAKVQGSRAKPYDVEILIDALSSKKWVHPKSKFPKSKNLQKYIR